MDLVLKEFSFNRENLMIFTRLKILSVSFSVWKVRLSLNSWLTFDLTNEQSKKGPRPFPQKLDRIPPEFFFDPIVQMFKEGFQKIFHVTGINWENSRCEKMIELWYWNLNWRIVSGIKGLLWGARLFLWLNPLLTFYVTSFLKLCTILRYL